MFRIAGTKKVNAGGIFCSVETLFFQMIAPLAPALPPLGAGALVIPRYYLINPTLLCTGNTAQS